MNRSNARGCFGRFR